MNDNRILSTLKSSNATLAVLVLALLAQTPHAADVFRLIVHSAGVAATAHSYSFAIALELAVLLFVVQNRRKESYLFAGVSIAMNLSYYHLHDVQLIALAALPALLVSFALPVAIARYSHAVADVHEAQPAQDAKLPDAIPATVADKPAIVADVQESIAPDATPGLQEQIASLRLEGFDDKWIAINGLRDIAGATLAEVLGVNASTISRWRKAAQSNGHTMEVAQ
jgi:hypothetical protein